MRYKRLASFLLSVVLCLQAAVSPVMASGTGETGKYAVNETEMSRTSVLSNGKVKKITPTILLSETEYVYDGHKKKPSVIVKDGETVLNPSDYKVSYKKGRRKIGRYKVKVTLKGRYSGKNYAYFKIVPKSTYIKSLSIASDEGTSPSFSLHWKKRSGTTGYQIQYSTDRDFERDVHDFINKGSGNTRAVLKEGIAENKTYFVRVRVYKTVHGTDYYSAWSDSQSARVEQKKKADGGRGVHGFSSQTEKIVNAHMNDFNYYSFDNFMARHGGATNYVRSLGGVFSKWCGVQAKVQTAGQFQEVAEYVMGIMTIWGPDYKGGGGEHKFNGRWGKGDQYGRFYAGKSVHRSWRCKPIEQVYFFDKEHIMTDCGCGITYIMQKAGLFKTAKYGGTEKKSTAWRKVDTSRGGTVITRKEGLQVGDLIQMSKTRHESGWKHVCVVGEIHPDGTIITYDTGNRYVNTGNYRKNFVVKEDGTLGGDYKGYKSWFGMRMRAIDQSDARVYR